MITAVAGALTFLLFLAVAALVYMPVYKTHYDAYGVRIRPRPHATVPVVADEAPESDLFRGCMCIGELVLGVLPHAVDSRTSQLMLQANYRTTRHMAAYIGVKAILTGATVLVLLLGSAGNPIQLFVVIPASLCAWVMPNFFLSGRVRQRQKAILSELPTVVDLMIVCAQAGLGLLMCMDKVSKEVMESCPLLSAEFQQFLRDVKVFASPTARALKEMGDRCGVDELNSMASTLISCEIKGSDISYPLKQQSEAIRDRIKRKKEEEASKTPVKMVPVIMLFIMPLILCPMLGPAIIIIIQALWPLFGLPGSRV